MLTCMQHRRHADDRVKWSSSCKYQMVLGCKAMFCPGSSVSSETDARVLSHNSLQLQRGLRVPEERDGMLFWEDLPCSMYGFMH